MLFSAAPDLLVIPDAIPWRCLHQKDTKLLDRGACLNKA